MPTDEGHRGEVTEPSASPTRPEMSKSKSSSLVDILKEAILISAREAVGSIRHLPTNDERGVSPTVAFKLNYTDAVRRLWRRKESETQSPGQKARDSTDQQSVEKSQTREVGGLDLNALRAAENAITAAARLEGEVGAEMVDETSELHDGVGREVQTARVRQRRRRESVGKSGVDAGRGSRGSGSRARDLRRGTADGESDDDGDLPHDGAENRRSVNHAAKKEGGSETRDDAPQATASAGSEDENDNVEAAAENDSQSDDLGAEARVARDKDVILPPGIPSERHAHNRDVDDVDDVVAEASKHENVSHTNAHVESDDVHQNAGPEALRIDGHVNREKRGKHGRSPENTAQDAAHVHVLESAVRGRGGAHERRGSHERHANHMSSETRERRIGGSDDDEVRTRPSKSAVEGGGSCGVTHREQTRWHSTQEETPKQMLLRALEREALILGSVCRTEKRPSSGEEKLCPRGAFKGLQPIDALHPAQRVPVSLIRPGGRRRVLVDMSAGAGKSCVIMGILSNFLNEDMPIVIVGDQDVQNAMREALQQCPASVDVVEHSERSSGPVIADRGPVLLRDLNRGASSTSETVSPFCALRSWVKDGLLSPRIKEEMATCPTNTKRWARSKPIILNYIEAGNWVKASPMTDCADVPLEDERGGRYGSLNAHCPAVWIVDEAHKLANPEEEPVSGAWRDSIVKLRDFFETVDDRSYVVFLSASPNVTSDPHRTISLFRACWGRSRPCIFNGGRHEQGCVVPEPEDFSNPAYGFVRAAKSVENVPVYTERSEKRQIMDAERVAKFLMKHGCLAQRDDDEMPMIMEPVRSEDNTWRLTRLLSGLCFATDNVQDLRYYPDVVKPYPHIRPVLLQGEARELYERLLDSDGRLGEDEINGAAKNKRSGKAKKSSRTGVESWSAKSQFTGGEVLTRIVEDLLRRELRTRDGTEVVLTTEQLREFERRAPKWAAAIDDLCSPESELLGKSIIYPGVEPVKISENVFLLGLAYYAKTRFSQRGVPHIIATLEDLLRPLDRGLGNDRLPFPDSTQKTRAKAKAKKAPELERKVVKQAKRGTERGKTAADDSHGGHAREVQKIYILADDGDGKKGMGRVSCTKAKESWRGKLASLKTDSPRPLPISLRDLDLLIGAVRDRQRDLFNRDEAASDGGGGPAALRRSKLILASGGYKALNFKGAGTMQILCPQTAGRFDQTAGRVRRTCSLASVGDYSKYWSVRVWVYMLGGGQATEELRPSDCDRLLQGWYDAQGQAVAWLRQLYIERGVACGAWRHFSLWQERYPGFSCLFEKEEEERRRLHSLRGLGEENFYRVDWGDLHRAENRQHIVPAVSGSVSAESARREAGEILRWRKLQLAVGQVLHRPSMEEIHRRRRRQLGVVEEVRMTPDAEREGRHGDLAGAIPRLEVREASDGTGTGPAAVRSHDEQEHELPHSKYDSLSGSDGHRAPQPLRAALEEPEHGLPHSKYDSPSGSGGHRAPRPLRTALEEPEHGLPHSKYGPLQSGSDGHRAPQPLRAAPEEQEHELPHSKYDSLQSGGNGHRAPQPLRAALEERRGDQNSGRRDRDSKDRSSERDSGGSEGSEGSGS
jgi:hypothetical protein